MTENPRDRIVERAAQELKSGMVVNLGIGLPTRLGNSSFSLDGVLLQSENGLLGIGPYPTEGEIDPDLINAGKETVTAVAGASYFDSALSFAMIRGRHVDLAVLGGLEVSAAGDLANWMVPGAMVKGPGGAMDLVVGAKRIVVLMEHVTKAGAPRIRAACRLPLTGRGVVDRLITDLAVFDFVGESSREMHLVERLTDMPLDEIRARTDAQFHTP